LSRLAQNSSVLSFIPYRSTYEFASLGCAHPTPGTSDGFGSFRGVPSPGIRTLLLCLLLTIAVLVCYNPVVHNGFLNYDDDQYITNNAHVRAGLTGQR